MGSPRKLLVAVAMSASLLALAALQAAEPAAKAPGPAEDSCCNQAKPTCCSDAARPAVQQTSLLAVHRQEAAKASPATLAKGVATRKALLDQVAALMEDGVADCCIGPGCALCPIAADGCGCAASLSKGGPVCPECWGGWQAGQGAIPGVKAEGVHILPTDVLKKVYGMKADKIKEASK